MRSSNVYEKYVNCTLRELHDVLDNVSVESVNNLIESILKAATIVLCGAGRMGLVAKGFAMRLGHLGFKSYFLGDSTVPYLGKGDLLLVCSGSGETKSILTLVEIAKKNDMSVFLVSGPKGSSIGQLSDGFVTLNNQNSVQPMKTLAEQSLQLFFDTVVMILIDKIPIDSNTLWDKHSNLE